MIRLIKKTGVFLLLIVIILQASCVRKRDAASTQAVKKTIQNTGSDTMVNLAQAWAETYAQVGPSISVEVSGGGSGTGIAALINGTVDIANCSRKMTPEEIEKAKQNTGKTPEEFLVAYDAIAVYVNRSNPLETITLDQLAEIYGEDGTIEKWSQLGVSFPKGVRDEIIVVSRQSNSGTYQYFREAIMGKERDFRLGTLDMNGSKDVIQLIARTTGAIGYSGMGYATSEVKMLKVARKSGEPAYGPTVENTLSGVYPIARPLFMYTLGRPTPVIWQYLDWIHSKAGQDVVVASGYVHLDRSDSAANPE